MFKPVAQHLPACFRVSTCASTGRAVLAFLLSTCFVLFAHAAHALEPANAPAETMPFGTGKQRIVLPAQPGKPSQSILIHTYRPNRCSGRCPVLMVMHGVNRNAADYRNAWIDAAKQHHFVVVAPEFDALQFTSDAYQRGGVQTNSDPLHWSFHAVELIFAALQTEAVALGNDYVLWGHSAGAQFVHRMMLLYPNPHIRLAVAANSGSYTLPDTTVQYPYGLKGVPNTVAPLNIALARQVVIALGTADTDSADRNLDQRPNARLQGAHRLARGEHFWVTLQAADIGQSQLNWRVHKVPGVGHDQQRMATATAAMVAASFAQIPDQPAATK